MRSFLPPLEPAGWVSHALHAPTRSWPENNCYTDLWIEVLHAAGFPPEAVLPFTVAQDYEGDQFTFSKMPLEDLDTLFGLVVQELAIYDTVEAHTTEQVHRGRLVLVEVDGFYLPDVRGTAYRQEHVKTTIGVAAIDPARRSLGYFHNTGWYALDGDDYDGVFRRKPELRDAPDILFPYVEMAHAARAALSGPALLRGSLELLSRHLRRRPRFNPITAYHDDLPRHLELLAARPMSYFHLYAFNVLRQLGANAELLASCLAWLALQGERGLDPAQQACGQIAVDAKSLQFQLARAVSRKRFDAYTVVLSRMEAAYDRALGLLTARYA